MDSYHFLFKFLIVGDASVGKSCLLSQYIDKKFKEDYNLTIGVEFGAKAINIADKIIKLQVWDTAGVQQFRSITRSYYRGAIGVLIVFNLANRDSFESIQGWYQEILQTEIKNQTIFLVGNKADLDNDRQVTSEEAKNFAEKHKLTYFETSAKNGQNVDLVFQACALDILSKIEPNIIDLSNHNLCIKVGTKYEEPKPANIQTIQVQKLQDVEAEEKVEG